MQTQASEIKTVEGWDSAILSLRQRKQALDERLAELRRRKGDLALEAGLGGDGAQKQLRAVNDELRKLSFEIDDLGTAIEQAAGGKSQAEQAAAEATEAGRRRQIAAGLRQYLAAVAQVDGHLEQLAIWFRKSREALDAAERSMTGPERQAVQQLRSTWGPSLACGFFGLHQYIEMGPRVTNVVHRKRLVDFSEPFVGPWLGPPSEDDGKE